MINSDKDKVAAFYVNERVVCADCMTDKDWNPLNQEMVITRKDAEGKDKIFFCDICQEPI
ncbi:MAG: hypothetical protein R6U40_07010 [Desulfobacterales bacterium]